MCIEIKNDEYLIYILNQMTALKRQEDGTILFGNHEYIWNLKGEGVDPERCKQIFIQDISEEGQIRIVFQVQDPADNSWRIGVASGDCPGKETWLAGYYYLNHPDDFHLLITRYNLESPVDYWLRDGDQLRRYQWEPWEENLLWTLDDVPGSLISIDWNENSQDLNGDGKPDLKIIWDLDTQEQEMIFTTDDQGFRLVDFNGN